MTKREIIKIIVEAFNKGNKLLIFGCGGSMAEASHMAAEFIGIGLPAIALNDPAVITALANDYTFNMVFSKQIFALGKKGDIAIALSTSGKSRSVIYGINKAKAMGLTVIDWPRNRGKTTGTIQEYQLKLIHEVFLTVNKNL